MDAEVLVVGAGPAGSSAAYHLARAGRRVLLLERHRFPRDKSCGDGLTRFAARLLAEMGVLPELEGTQVARGVRVVMRGRGSRTFEYPAHLPEPNAGRVVPRLDLDHVICRKAIAAGAELWEEALVTRLVRENGVVSGVEVDRRGERTVLRAPVVVAADGAASRLASQAGLGGTPRERLGFAIRGYYTDVEGLAELLEIYTPLLDPTDRYLLPSYGWVFPTGPGTANVGVGLFERERGANVRELFVRFLETLRREDPRFARARPSAPWKGAPLRFDFAPERCTAPGLLLVGDAAGLISPFTGEGIGYALESGKLAAETIHRRLQPGMEQAPELSDYVSRLAQSYTGYFETGRQSAKRYRLVWHVLASTFHNERPLFTLCRQVALFPEGLGESYTEAALDDVGDLVEQTELPVRADLVSVGELLIDAVRRDWPFLARALTVGQSDPGIPFRPALLLLLSSYAGGDARRPAVFLAGAAIELGFLAALAHFSVEDERLPAGADGRDSAGVPAATNGSQPANWGNMSALLVGDFLLAKAHELGAAVGAGASGLIADALARACDGRVGELRNAHNPRLEEAEHLDILARKTAGFFELPCRLGAAVGGVSPSHAAGLARYGRCLGMAHELTDEAMLAAGRPGKLARVTGTRIKDGVYGLPVLLALEADGRFAGSLQELLARTDLSELARVGGARRARDAGDPAAFGGRDSEAPDPAEGVEQLLRIVRESGAIEATLRRARGYSDQAQQALAVLPDGPARRSLTRLADYAVERAGEVAHGPANTPPMTASRIRSGRPP